MNNKAMMIPAITKEIPPKILYRKISGGTSLLTLMALERLEYAGLLITKDGDNPGICLKQLYPPKLQLYTETKFFGIAIKFMINPRIAVMLRNILKILSFLISILDAKGIIKKTVTGNRYLGPHVTDPPDQKTFVAYNTKNATKNPRKRNENSLFFLAKSLKEKTAVKTSGQYKINPYPGLNNCPNKPK